MPCPRRGFILHEILVLAGLIKGSIVKGFSRRLVILYQGFHANLNTTTRNSHP